MMNFKSRIEIYIAKHGLMSKNDRVLVTLSGGADSVSLLMVLLSLGYDCVAVHCNFHLRGEESFRDQHFAEDLCRKLDVRLMVRDFDTIAYSTENGVSIEMAARTQRYSAFEELRNECGAEVIAVAHHRDDSVETVLLNLTRGTGIRGLTGIKPKNGYIVRPLLCVSKSDIEDYLKSLDQSFVTDSTNLLSDFTRNKIRLRLLPLMREINPSVEDSIMDTSMKLQQVFDVYISAVRSGIERVSVTDNDIIKIDIDKLRKEPSVGALLFEMLFPLGFNNSQIADIENSLLSESGKMFHSESHVVIKDRDNILISRSRVDKTKEGDISVRVCDELLIELFDGRKLFFELKPSDFGVIRDSSIATLDADRVGDVLVMRYVKSGDSFIPFGMNGRKLLSDYMTDRKFNLLQKDGQMVVCNDKDIVWVIGERIDNRYRVSNETKRILLISIR
jgi:tRNA(Ile)-lysidine synthase